MCSAGETKLCVAVGTSLPDGPASAGLLDGALGYIRGSERKSGGLADPQITGMFSHGFFWNFHTFTFYHFKSNL